MVTLQDVYDAFLAKVTDEDWEASGCTAEEIEWMIEDWHFILMQAISYFKFPRCDLSINEQTKTFVDPNMSQDEIQVLATYMKRVWINRTIDHWENVKPQYAEKDFSQANLLKTFISLKDQVKEEAQEVEALYYRSRQKKPFRFGALAGGNRN